MQVNVHSFKKHGNEYTRAIFRGYGYRITRRPYHQEREKPTHSFYNDTLTLVKFKHRHKCELDQPAVITWNALFAPQFLHQWPKLVLKLICSTCISLSVRNFSNILQCESKLTIVLCLFFSSCLQKEGLG